MSEFEYAEILGAAIAKEGVDDWGPGDFEEPLRVLVTAYADAGLSELGTQILRNGVIHSLRMRLRSQAWFTRHPEIAEEVIDDPVIVVGMMRSGTTLMQRLLAADGRFTCAYGWEVQQVAPRLDWDPAADDPRIASALAREEATRTFAADLFAIHPMYALEAEEEIVFLADAFYSHVPESGAHVPAYRRWLDQADFTPAYDYLHRMLQLLQWQKRVSTSSTTTTVSTSSTTTTTRRWVLKTPAHLGYLDEVLARFPGAHIVHLHRDPRDTIASGASLNATLHAMHSDHVDLHRLGAEWIERMGWTNDRAMATRERWGSSGPVTDVAFEDVVADPVGQSRRVLAAVGMEPDPDGEERMRDWLERRPREEGRPDYRPETYGLSNELIDERFAAYNARFRSTH